jgi:nucleoside-diphosphate-sugar epimerase
MSSTPLRVLVTGASGFLGSNILKAFQSQPEVRLIAACRQPGKLAEDFNAEVRVGDLRDPRYIDTLVRDVDVICHAGTWAAMWSHTQQEQRNFYQPSVNLIEAAISAGVQRFLLASTVAIAKRNSAVTHLDASAKTQKVGFWPHLDYLIDLDNYMKANAQRGLQMVNMRLGHFVGAGNSLGLVPVLLPRLKTYLVPWLAKGNSRLPLIADTDLGMSFVKASLATNLDPYESFNICGTSFPTTREVIEYIAAKTNLPTPLFSVPYPLGYAFAWLMEKLYPVMPGKAPFLTRSVVHLAEQWVCDTDAARRKIGFRAEKDWRIAMAEALADLKARNFPWPYMAQREQR